MKIFFQDELNRVRFLPLILKRIFFGVLLTGFVTSPAVFAASLELETFTTHSRLSVRIDPGVSTTINNRPEGFEIVFKGITLFDLGASFESPKGFLDSLAKVADSRVSALKAEENTAGVVLKGTWKYPSGTLAPAYPKMEYFEFREKNPPRIVMDFWPGRGPTVAEVRVQREIQQKAEARRLTQEKVRNRMEKRLAKAKEQDAINDVVRFCAFPLSDKDHFFPRFYPAHQEVNFRKWFPVQVADDHYQYFSPKDDHKDSQYTRLILKLYQSGNFGLALRTIEFLEKEFPTSRYIPEMLFLKSNALIKLGHPEQALELLRQISSNYRQLPISIYAGTFLATHAFEEKQYLLSLESFLGLIQTHGTHRLAWVFHLGAAESFYYMKQVDRAVVEYEWIVQNAKSKEVQSKAALRLGDLYLNRYQYDRALASYGRALRDYPEQAKNFPEIFLNRGEAFYWSGEFERAKKEFLTFSEKFTGHGAGWRADYRLGEIFGRAPGAESRKTSREWFYRTINDYPTSKGATLARLQLLPCDDNGLMGVDTAKTFFEREAKSLEPGDEVAVNEVKDFLYVNFIRYLISQKRYDMAVNYLVESIDENLTARSKTILGKTFKAVFKSRIDQLLDEEKQFDALAFYEEYSDKLGRFGEKLFPDTYLRLSRAAADLELGGIAIDFYAQFESIKTNRELATKKDDLDDRLAASEVAFTEAKALWVKNKTESKAEGKPDEKIGRIKELLALVIDESPFSYQREIIFSQIDIAKENATEALRHAVQAQLLMGQYSVHLDLQVDYWLATLYRKSKQIDPAIQALERIQQAQKSSTKQTTHFMDSLGVPALPNAQTILLELADLYEQKKEWGKVAGTFGELYNQAKDNNRFSYGYLRALRNTGKKEDNDLALKILKDVATSKTDDFWKKLAQEELASNQ